MFKPFVSIVVAQSELSVSWHATKEAAIKKAKKDLDEYGGEDRDFAEVHTCKGNRDVVVWDSGEEND